MRKTFAWRYYKETGDIYYLQALLNHASPSITYRYIGEKPNVEVQLKKMTAEENARSRQALVSENRGTERIDAIIEVLADLKQELDNAGKNGGKCALFVKQQSLTGDIIVDEISSLEMQLTESSYTGAIRNDGAVSVTLEDNSTWTLTGDSYVTEFNGDAANVISNGYTLYVNGVALIGTN